MTLPASAGGSRVPVIGRGPGRNSFDLATGQRCTVAGLHESWCRYPGEPVAAMEVRSTTDTVDETIATDNAVFTAPARFVLGHDLVTQVVFKHVPPEHPLRRQLADFRADRTPHCLHRLHWF